MDEFIEEHAEQYERAVERWKNCTMEEWIAGADGGCCVFRFDYDSNCMTFLLLEQVARFQKVFDFVSPRIRFSSVVLAHPRILT